MQCSVRLFAQARDLAGTDRMTLDLPQNATVRDALNAILQSHPDLEPLCQRLAVAVDERYAQMDSTLRDGCIIALIPPVSGG